MSAIGCRSRSGDCSPNREDYRRALSGNRQRACESRFEPREQNNRSETRNRERITRIRKQAVEENVLSIRTRSANSRVVSEVLKRLSALTETEIHYLADDDTPASDRQALMWVPCAGITHWWENSPTRCCVNGI